MTMTYVCTKEDDKFRRIDYYDSPNGPCRIVPPAKKEDGWRAEVTTDALTALDISDPRLVRCYFNPFGEPFPSRDAALAALTEYLTLAATETNASAPYCIDRKTFV